MPVEWHWYDTQKSIIHFTFQAPWTSDEFRQANQSANAACENMDHVVDAIFNVVGVSIFPRDIVSTIIDLTRRTTWEPHQGATIIVGASPSIKMLMHVVSQIVPEGDLYLAKDLDHAMRIAHKLQVRRSDES